MVRLFTSRVRQVTIREKEMYYVLYKPRPVFLLLDSSGKKVLKNTKLNLDLLTYIDVLLMVEKLVRGGICHSIY